MGWIGREAFVMGVKVLGRVVVLSPGQVLCWGLRVQLKLDYKGLQGDLAHSQYITAGFVKSCCVSQKSLNGWVFFLLSFIFNSF